MIFDDFLKYASDLLELHHLRSMLKTPVSKDPQVLDYLESRGIEPRFIDFLDLEIYAYEGKITFQKRPYNLSKSLVFPLRDPQGRLIGVQVRSILEKRFYIWLIGDTSEKYWIPADNSGKTQDPGNRRVVVTESILDAISLRILYPEFFTVSSLGVTISPTLMRYLMDHNSLLALDNDKPGKQSMMKILKSNQSLGILDPKSLGKFKDFNELLVSCHKQETKKPSITTYQGVRGLIHLRSLV